MEEPELSDPRPPRMEAVILRDLAHGALIDVDRSFCATVRGRKIKQGYPVRWSEVGALLAAGLVRHRHLKDEEKATPGHLYLGITRKGRKQAGLDN